MQFPNGAVVAGVGGGGEINYPRPWYPDERDGFISWLRAEFAASNAIIDSLCHHLRSVGDPGEYDLVIGCIQQRRVTWNHVLHMQQFFPVTDVGVALQQVAWRRQPNVADKRSGVQGFGSRNGQWGEAGSITKEGNNLSVYSPNIGANIASVAGSKEKKGTGRDREEEKLGDDVRKSGVLDAQKVIVSQVDNPLKTSGNRDGTDYPSTQSLSEDVKDGKTSNSKGSYKLIAGKKDDAIKILKEESLTISARTFHAVEINDGKTVNVAEGLNLYEELICEEEVSKLISLVNDLRATGKRGQLLGSTFAASKRPYRGHGREMIQLGVAVSEAQSDDNSAKDGKVEPIPDLLQSIIDRLINKQLTPMKPDSCIIDVFHEGDHSAPLSFPFWYGRPICLLCLNACDMVFGTSIVQDSPGIYRGALSLTLAPGSLLVMQGNSTDVAKRAISSIRKQRILVTFLKSQPRKTFQGDSQRLHLQAAHAPNWAPPSRPPNHIRPKHYTQVSIAAAGVLPAPPIRAQFPPSNGSPPLFVPPPVATPMAFPASMPLPTGSAGWPVTAPRLPPPRLLVPGTGVFLPPPATGSTWSVGTKTAAAEISVIIKTARQVEAKKEDVEVNGSILNSPKECNGSVRAVTKEDHQQKVDSKAASEITTETA